MAELYDSVGRRINYLRVAVTDKCNFRCQYCMSSAKIKWMSREQILNYEEILRLIHLFAVLGVDKIRVTGGEPLLRKDLLGFLKQTKVISGIKEVNITTNGSMLEKYARLLKEAGVDRINISLDTLKSERFLALTGKDDLKKVMKGIKLVEEAGFSSIKINVVVMKGYNTDELPDFAALAADKEYQIRFIEYMPIGGNKDYYFSAEEMKKQLAEAGFRLGIAEDRGSCPAENFHFSGAKGAVGFITPVSRHFCNSCNRMRLTADGVIKPCLLSNEEYPIREMLRSGTSDEELLKVLRNIVMNKPKQHHLEERQLLERGMSQIGG